MVMLRTIALQILMMMSMRLHPFLAQQSNALDAVRRDICFLDVGSILRVNSHVETNL